MLLRNNSTRSAHLLQIVQRRIGRSPGIPDACGIEKIAGLCSAVDGILIQTVAVQVPSSHSQIIVTTLYKILGRIHVAVDIESFALQIVKFLVVSLIIMPVRKVLSMGEDDSIRSADQRRYILKPSLGIRLDMFQRRITDPDMSPGMACEGPAVRLDRFRYLLCLLALFLPVKIRMFFQPFYLIIAEIFPGFICAVSKISIAGKSAELPLILLPIL